MTSVFAWGGPAGGGTIRSRPEDFEVEEILGHEPTGDGEHLWLWVEKRGHNTVDVASSLARAAGVHPRQVSFAGLKDRNAVTRQYYSIHLPGQDDPDWTAWSGSGIRILNAVRSSRKIRRGRLKANRFRLIVRDLAVDHDKLQQRLVSVREHGAPNGFGEQRFGGNNIARARALFAGQLRRKPSRHKRGFYLSASRSLLFNRVLVHRIADGSWNRMIDGDVAQLDGSHSIFVPEPDDPDLSGRCEEMDLHPTGPLAGCGESPVSGEVAVLEREIFSHEADLVRGLEQFGLRHERRALRMAVRDLEWQQPEPDTLRLDFTLGQGSYATSVLRELIEYDIST